MCSRVLIDEIDKTGFLLRYAVTPSIREIECLWLIGRFPTRSFLAGSLSHRPLGLFSFIGGVVSFLTLSFCYQLELVNRMKLVRTGFPRIGLKPAIQMQFKLVKYFPWMVFSSALGFILKIITQLSRVVRPDRLV